MTDLLLLWVSDYGVLVISLTTLLSCFALPLPSSLMMMAGGAFAAAGDLVLWQLCAGAFLGAFSGAEISYYIARKHGGARLWQWLRQRKEAANLLTQAESLLDRHGGWAVYLTRWLFAPMGPYVNLIAGATQMPWRRVVLADLTGGITWVAVYVSLGYAFGNQIEALSDTLGSVLGALTAGVVTVLLGLALWRKRREQR